MRTAVVPATPTDNGTRQVKTSLSGRDTSRQSSHQAERSSRKRDPANPWIRWTTTSPAKKGPNGNWTTNSVSPIPIRSNAPSTRSRASTRKWSGENSGAKRSNGDGCTGSKNVACSSFGIWCASSVTGASNGRSGEKGGWQS